MFSRNKKIVPGAPLSLPRGSLGGVEGCLWGSWGVPWGLLGALGGAGGVLGDTWGALLCPRGGLGSHGGAPMALPGIPRATRGTPGIPRGPQKAPGVPPWVPKGFPRAPQLSQTSSGDPPTAMQASPDPIFGSENVWDRSKHERPYPVDSSRLQTDQQQTADSPESPVWLNARSVTGISAVGSERKWSVHKVHADFLSMYKAIHGQGVTVMPPVDRGYRTGFPRIQRGRASGGGERGGRVRGGWGNLGLFSRVPGGPGAALWAPVRARGVSESAPSSPQRHSQVSKYMFDLQIRCFFCF